MVKKHILHYPLFPAIKFHIDLFSGYWVTDRQTDQNSDSNVPPPGYKHN